ncbi:HAD-IA family hydrolase [Saccharibacillus sp. CPCC 101409]|uniref:HAD family hydrolase n=1 Tax=Saccharibacillus sp. CPCC 101409 TaxID=3058041 RepID=UPI002671B112|nr:HAD-IA family hydrolase [Saccharibacillus sp. CPCC 101409]MDO3410801.1 HAD-IA family hydrolase [Saccharibacillus sp. CPCC 101409]
MSAERYRPQLVFDVGGVLAANLDRFWSTLAQAEGLDRAGLRGRYKAEIGSGLWSGAVAEKKFWEWLDAVCPATGSEEAARLLRSVLTPLPALDRLEAWSRSADIHILSNHVAAWILPLFAGVEDRISSMTISSEAGCYKPGARIFELAAAGLAPGDVCFVDDTPGNLEAARGFGWETLLADEAGEWTLGLDAWLQRQTARG